MTVETLTSNKPYYFNTALPANTDARSEGPEHIRNEKSVMKEMDRARFTDKSAAYTFVISDENDWFYHPSTDANARTWTIPSNASVPFPRGTTLTFINETSQAITIAITSDTLVLASTGSTGSRTLAQYGWATAVKVGSTRWYINGAGLT